MHMRRFTCDFSSSSFRRRRPPVVSAAIYTFVNKAVGRSRDRGVGKIEYSLEGLECSSFSFVSPPYLVVAIKYIFEEKNS